MGRFGGGGIGGPVMSARPCSLSVTISRVFLVPIMYSLPRSNLLPLSRSPSRELFPHVQVTTMTSNGNQRDPPPTPSPPKRTKKKKKRIVAPERQQKGKGSRALCCDTKNKIRSLLMGFTKSIATKSVCDAGEDGHDTGWPFYSFFFFISALVSTYNLIVAGIIADILLCQLNT